MTAIKEFRLRSTLEKIFLDVILAEFPEFQMYKGFVFHRIKKLNVSTIDKILNKVYLLLKELYK